MLYLIQLSNYRLCRPGSIVGPQQQYLASIEGRMLREGIEYRNKHRLPHPTVPHGQQGGVDDGSVDARSSAATTPLSMSISGSSYDGRVMTPPLIINSAYRKQQQPAGTDV